MGQSTSSEPKAKNAAFSLGVIADVQWADIDDGTNFDGSVKRCYRGALKVLGAAVRWWAKVDEPPTLIAQLGDLIDGKNAALGHSQRALDAAVALLAQLECRKVHLLGNHELYNFNRQQLREQLDTGRFYAVAPVAGWRVLVLDPYRESIILPQTGSDAERQTIVQSEPFRRALSQLQANNPNDVLGPADWSRGMSGYARRFVPYNGGLGSEQAGWLRAELAAAEASRERVLILSHVVLHPEACDGTTMVYDFQVALDAIAEHSGCVVAVLCGHDHKGSYHRDEHGVHHLTFKSPLNKGADGHAYGHVAVHADRLVLSSPALADLIPLGGGLPAPQRRADGAEAIELPFVERP